MATTFSSFASYERATIRRRLSEGKAMRARAGYLPQGQIPYGYAAAKNQPVQVVPEEAEVIRMIYRLYVDENMSQKKITEYLTALGIPSPASTKETGIRLQMEVGVLLQLARFLLQSFMQLDNTDTSLLERTE